MGIDRTLLLLSVASQLFLLPFLFTYWQSDWLRGRTNAAAAWIAASIKADRLGTALKGSMLGGLLSGLIWSLRWFDSIAVGLTCGSLILIGLFPWRPRPGWSARFVPGQLELAVSGGIHWDTQAQAL